MKTSHMAAAVLFLLIVLSRKNSPAIDSTVKPEEAEPQKSEPSNSNNDAASIPIVDKKEMGHSVSKKKETTEEKAARKAAKKAAKASEKDASPQARADAEKSDLVILLETTIAEVEKEASDLRQAVFNEEAEIVKENARLKKQEKEYQRELEDKKGEVIQFSNPDKKELALKKIDMEIEASKRREIMDLADTTRLNNLKMSLAYKTKYLFELQQQLKAEQNK